MRRPAKPGSWRVKPSGGRYRLSGVRQDGERVSMYVRTEDEGNALGKTLFGNSINSTPAPSIGPIHQPLAASPVDDWGFPVKVSPEVAASVNASFGIKPAPPVTIPTTLPSEDEVKKREERERKAKNAKSLMEMVGVGYAAGTVAVSKKWVKSTGREPLKPNPKQVNDLADATRDTFVEWFGDRELKPWHMMFLLSLGIPISLWIQSPKVEKKEEDSSDDKPNLKSVR